MRWKDQPLTKVLIEFAEILGTDFSVQAILEHLVKRILDILPVTGIGVMLTGDAQELHLVADSNGSPDQIPRAAVTPVLHQLHATGA